MSQLLDPITPKSIKEIWAQENSRRWLESSAERTAHIDGIVISTTLIGTIVVVNSAIDLFYPFEL